MQVCKFGITFSIIGINSYLYMLIVQAMSSHIMQTMWDVKYVKVKQDICVIKKNITNESKMSILHKHRTLQSKKDLKRQINIHSHHHMYIHDMLILAHTCTSFTGSFLGGVVNTRHSAASPAAKEPLVLHAWEAKLVCLTVRVLWASLSSSHRATAGPWRSCCSRKHLLELKVVAFLQLGRINTAWSGGESTDYFLLPLHIAQCRCKHF